MAPPGTRIGHVVQHIHDLIRRQELEVGAALPFEGQVSQELGISRGTVREGYRMLAATGAVELSNGRAPRVGSLSAQPVTTMLRHVLDTGQVGPLHVLQFRRAIEVQAASLAALERSEAEATALLDTVQEMRQYAAAGHPLTVPDLKFHALLAQASGNPLFEILT